MYQVITIIPIIIPIIHILFIIPIILFMFLIHIIMVITIDIIMDIIGGVAITDGMVGAVITGMEAVIVEAEAVIIIRHLSGGIVERVRKIGHKL